MEQTIREMILQADDEKDPDNAARLYGSAYYDLLDATESIVIQTLEQIGISHDKYITDQFIRSLGIFDLETVKGIKKEGGAK